MENGHVRHVYFYFVTALKNKLGGTRGCEFKNLVYSTQKNEDEEGWALYLLSLKITKFYVNVRDCKSPQKIK